MPNYCSNILTIKGDKKIVNDFVAAVQTPDPEHEGKLNVIDFNVHVPIEDGNNFAAQWGTKWIIDTDDGSWDDVIESDEATEAIASFFSAWSPPLQWALTTSSIINNLRFTVDYDEPGNGFRGTYIVENGKVLYQQEEDYIWGEEEQM